MKNRTLVFLVFLITCFFGCSHKEEKSSQNSVIPNAFFYTNADTLMSEIELRDGVYFKKGESEPFTGLSLEITIDGYRKEETHYKEGKLHGPKTKWDHKGVLFSLDVYEDNIAVYRKEFGEDAVMNANETGVVEN